MQEYTIHANSARELLRSLKWMHGMHWRDHSDLPAFMAFNFGHHVTGDALRDYDWHAYVTVKEMPKGTHVRSSRLVMDERAFNDYPDDYTEEIDDTPHILWNSGSGTVLKPVTLITRDPVHA